MQEIPEPVLTDHVTMCSRRDALRNGLLLVAGCAIGRIPELEAQAPRRRRTLGCLVDAEDSAPFLNSATPQAMYETGLEPMIASSGDRDFDYALAQTLAKISDLFDVLPAFGFYDDYEAPNAKAVATIRGREDGTVLFGQRLLKKLLATPENPDAAVAAVCAHEFGHILQLKRKLRPRVMENQSTGKHLELQADFFAGYFAGIRKRERADFPAAVFALTQYNFGDDEVTRADHHGTSQERGDAISKGFDASFRQRLTLSDAVEASVVYVTRL